MTAIQGDEVKHSDQNINGEERHRTASWGSKKRIQQLLSNANKRRQSLGQALGNKVRDRRRHSAEPDKSSQNKGFSVFASQGGIQFLRQKVPSRVPSKASVISTGKSTLERGREGLNKTVEVFRICQWNMRNYKMHEGLSTPPSSPRNAVIGSEDAEGLMN